MDNAREILETATELHNVARQLQRNEQMAAGSGPMAERAAARVRRLRQRVNHLAQWLVANTGS